MDEFVEQFLIEARELVEQGTAALVALEKAGNPEREIDALFRAVHTLKGAAGIVEFDAMGRALHAVEGFLSQLRLSAKQPPPNFARDCYACLDQVTRWLNDMQTTGAPPENGDVAGDEIVCRFDGGAPSSDVLPATSEVSWLKRMRTEHPVAWADSTAAFLYRPKEDAFFRGDDPLVLAATVPGLAVIDLSMTDDVVLEDLDPFSCVIQISALTTGSVEEVQRIFHNVLNQAEIVNLAKGAEEATDDRDLSPAARSVLTAQVLMLELGDPGERAGRVGSAGKIALNIVRSAGIPERAAAIEIALAETSLDVRRKALIAAIKSALQEPARVVAVAEAQQPQAAPAATRSLRVDMDRIDALVNLTGELIVVKNAIGHIAGMSHATNDMKSIGLELRKQHDLFERLVQQLQSAVLEVRVLPLRHVFRRFPRLIREISATLGKPVKFVLEGEATEADATVVESLFEPLLHVLRNAIGHGIEAPPERISAGKTAISTIGLRAYRRLDNVIVEVEDDGKGVDIERVRQTALERQVVTADDLARMSEKEIVALIFAPGFSTAAAVTGLSGRGVGMDAVKTAVERIGGHVSVHTRVGLGTTIQLVLPFSVMMTRVMTVEVSGQVFGLPLDSVVETASVARAAIIAVGAGRALDFRNRTLPVLDLSAELDLPRTAVLGDEAKVVVVASGDQLGAIEVDGLGGRMDVMLKPMEGLLQGMKGVAGTTLLGDGRILLVLDIQELLA